MAIDITINLNDDLERELVKQTAENNAQNPSAPPLTPSQFLRRDVRDRLQLAIQQRQDEDRRRFGAVYKNATPEDQALMDAIAARTTI